MATQYTTILKLALPVQGELSGTWGDVVNNNITSMVEEAVAGRKVINTWTANSHTLTSADGTTSESRAAILTLTDTGTALSGAGTVVCPAASKIYIVENGTAQVITVKTASGTGIAVPVGKNMVVFCDGTNVEEGISNIASLSIGGDGATVTGIKDEDDMSSNSATKLATQQSIKAYVDSQVTAQDLDVTDGSTTISIDLDSESLGILGGTGIGSTASGNNVTLAIDATVATLTGSQTLTNKTLTSPDINAPDIDGGAIDDAVIGGATPAAGSFTTIAASGNVDFNADVDVDGTLETDALTINGVASVPFEAADHSKLDGIEASADVTDTANVTAAGALMDSELTSIASVKALNQGVATTDSPTFAGITTSGTTNTANLTVSGTQGSDGQVLTSTGSGVQWEDAAGGGVDGITSSTTTTIITLSSANKVGIGQGVGNAGAQLHVYQASGSGDLLKVQTGSGTHMLMDSSGNLGIGTSSPSQLLDVNGTVELNNLTVGGSQGSDGQVLTSTGSGVQWESVSGGVNGISSFTSTTCITLQSTSPPRITMGQNSSANALDNFVVQVYRDSSTAYNPSTSGSTAHVGRGGLIVYNSNTTTNSMAGISFVNGAKSSTAYSVINNYSLRTGVREAELVWEMNHGSNSRELMRLKKTSNNQVRFGINVDAPANVLDVKGEVRFQGWSNANVFIVDPSNARVGIGTNSPTNTLTVSGNANVTGSLAKGSGSFRIDHPLPAKTATHELVHSFIEGPQADLIYRGKVTLVDGSATINVDTASRMTEGTFEVLCGDVQCFTSNESGWTAVKGTVSGNTLTITAQENTCTDTISWMVVGERKDPHMIDTNWTDEDGRVIVEPLKESN